MVISVLLYIVGLVYSLFLAHPISHCSDSTPSQAPFDLIVKNNLSLTMLLIFGFGVLTTTNLLLNGFIIGSIVRSATVCIPKREILLLTLPHGILEIPAIIIAGAAGFKIPYEIVRYLVGKKERILTKEDAKEYLTLALISIVLIVIAAFLEAFITPRVAEYFLK